MSVKEVPWWLSRQFKQFPSIQFCLAFSKPVFFVPCPTLCVLAFCIFSRILYRQHLRYLDATIGDEVSQCDGHSNTRSLFTPLTLDKTKLVLSSLVLSMSAVWIELATRQNNFVSSRLSFQFATVQSQIYWGLLKTSKLETGSRQDKTVFVSSPVVFTPPTLWTSYNGFILLRSLPVPSSLFNVVSHLVSAS